MREFTDENGRSWVATVGGGPATDYKGRYYLHLRPSGAEQDAGVDLRDVRWNSLGTAERTLATMSGVELRRRLRSALGRASISPSAGP